MSEHRIRAAQIGDTEAIATMMAELWPGGTVEEFRHETAALISSGMCGSLPAMIVVALDNGGSLNGFLQTGLRSHADGCDPARPVGFIEGWFVRRTERRKGIGTALMKAAEEWARAHGCLEMASDAVIGNQESLQVHAALGFEIVDRCVHFRKPIL